MFDEFIKEAIFMVALFSGLPLLCGSISGLVVAVVQTATQIQEQSISFIAKLSTAIVVFLFISRWLGRELVNFFQQVLGSIESMGGM